MRKKLVSLLIASAMAISLIACGGNNPETEEAKTENVAESEEEIAEEPIEEPAEEVTYQSILDEYTQKIIDATPELVEEFNNEAAGLTGSVEELAELSNAKVEKLALISTDGVTEMAELMQRNGDEYEVYEEWSIKLTDIYTEYAEKIMDAYIQFTTE